MQASRPWPLYSRFSPPVAPQLPPHADPLLPSLGHPCTGLQELFSDHHTSTGKWLGEAGEKTMVMWAEKNDILQCQM